jgi:HEAT repeat protein
MGKSAKSAIPALIPLLKDEDSEVRAKVTEVFSEIGEPEKSVISLLIPLLQDPDKVVRSSAAEALNKLGYKP